MNFLFLSQIDSDFKIFAGICTVGTVLVALIALLSRNHPDHKKFIIIAICITSLYAIAATICVTLYLLFSFVSLFDMSPLGPPR